MTIKVAGRIATAGVVLALATVASQAEEITLPTFDVVATTPLGGGDIDVAKSPFAVWQTNSQYIQTFNDSTLPDTLARSAPQMLRAVWPSATCGTTGALPRWSAT